MVNIMHRTFFKSRRWALGKCMIKHGEPIDMKTYVDNFFKADKSNGPSASDLKNHTAFEELSLQLTRDIYRF